MSFIFVMAKLYFQQASLQLSESHDPSEIIYADLVIKKHLIVESCLTFISAVYYFCGNIDILSGLCDK